MMNRYERTDMLLNTGRLTETADSLRTGEIDPVTYLSDLCDRIEDVDPEIRALLPEDDRRARLMTSSSELAERFDPVDRPPLYGVPIGIKDICHVRGFPTKAGGGVPPDLFGGGEAAVVERFRDAGALVVGKTVTTEFAMSAPGPTRNPHDTEHTPGGSSSGSAAAVAAGLCPLAIGTQTNGSVIRPAAFCGVVGYKPSLGRIPTDGLVTLSPSADHVGLFTRTTAGMELAASVACRGWRDIEPVEKPTLGVVDGPYLEQASPTAKESLARGAARLETAGYEVHHETAFEDIGAVNRRQKDLTAAEISLELGSLVKRHEESFRPITVDRVREGYDVTAEELLDARDSRVSVRRSLENRMESAGIDLWLSPAAVGPAPPGIDDTGDPIMNKPWTHAGTPVLTVPSDTVEELPVGLQIAAAFEADERLLAWAGGIEAALKP